MLYHQEFIENAKHCRCYHSPVKHDCNTEQPCASGLIDEIMKKYYCQRAHQGSSCSLFSDRRGSQYSMDRRLLYWTQILEDRKRIACRIKKVTGKRLSHVLYNQLDEYRNVQNVKRIIDFAQRLDPTKLSTRTCNHIQDPNLFETLPLCERQRKAENLEIVGTPKISQFEQCIHLCAGSNNSFLTSNFLQRKLEAKNLKMQNILEFYPDIDRLQVVGQRIHKHAAPTAERISNYELSETSSESNQCSCKGSEFLEYSIKIDDTILRSDMKSTASMKFNLKFKCKPYERQMQTICKVKNIGRKPVFFVWKKIKPIGSAYIQPNPPAFIFNRNVFLITYGESEDVEVVFMSTERMIREEQWCLKTEPDFFEDTYNIEVNLSAECYIPEDYFTNITWDLMDTLLCSVIPGGSCDTRRRVPTEKELFEKYNPGFKCEQDDLRKFKELYRQIKKKSHPSVWDMNLQTLKQLIEGIEDFSQRNIYLETFMNIIRKMRRRVPDCDSNIKILLTKRLILMTFDKWESKALQIVEVIARTPIDVLIIKMPFDIVIEQLKQCTKDEEKRKIILHNALYIQMYCSFCDLAEEIVSFMENCLLLYAF